MVHVPANRGVGHNPSDERSSSMEYAISNKWKGGVAVLAAAAVVALGLATAGVGLLWVAGSLGISAAAATQIVVAIEKGGWALRAVILIFGGGIISAIMATVLAILAAAGTAAAVA